METDQLKELKRLQKENERLRKAVSDLTLDKLILSEAAKGNFRALRAAGGALIGFAASLVFRSAEPAACRASILMLPLSRQNSSCIPVRPVYPEAAPVRQAGGPLSGPSSLAACFGPVIFVLPALRGQGSSDACLSSVRSAPSSLLRFYVAAFTQWWPPVVVDWFARLPCRFLLAVLRAAGGSVA